MKVETTYYVIVAADGRYVNMNTIYNYLVPDIREATFFQTQEEAERLIPANSGYKVARVSCTIEVEDV